ncbi:MAG: hypothetical protein M3Q75_05050 [Gemmatimonadota bacterium]|nr:hypothetical protein [Gemmatimonadota bacterium]
MFAAGATGVTRRPPGARERSGSAEGLTAARPGRSRPRLDMQRTALATLNEELTT